MPTRSHARPARSGILCLTLLAVAVATGALGCQDNPDLDRDGTRNQDDCAPTNPDIRPGAVEVCDGIDNDCDGAIDELFDLDGDGFLADDAGCRALGGVMDCDDLDPTVNPEAMELADGLDNNCDGVIDESEDGDGDGFGAFDDCNDQDPFIHPDAPEACDGIDNNCDGVVDPLWDEDGDGASTCAGDCDDSDPAVGPHLPEICDNQDNDCDNLTDEGFDQDGDGFTVCRGDCNDDNPAMSPAMDEICGDGIDNDCNPQTSELDDPDGDGYTFCGGDCDESNPDVHPGATELCDGIDNDCSGVADEPLGCWNCTNGGNPNYLVCLNAVPFARARDACTGFGGSMVIMNDATENSLVSNLAWSVAPGEYWLGLTDQVQEGVWRWVDGSLLSFSSWAGGEPNNSGNEDCADTNFNNNIGRWNDLPCSASLRFICEF